MLANQLMLTKGNCQPKGNSEQQPDANRTLDAEELEKSLVAQGDARIAGFGL